MPGGRARRRERDRMRRAWPGLARECPRAPQGVTNVAIQARRSVQSIAVLAVR
jgi:hypothetical protein